MATTERPSRLTPAPVMRVTQYDKASSGVLLICAAMTVFLVVLISISFSVRIDPPIPVIAVDFIDREGGYEDGDIDGTGEFNLNPTDPNSALAPGIAEQSSAVTALADIAESIATDVAETVSGEGSGEISDAIEMSMAPNTNVATSNNANPLDFGAGTGSGGRGGSPTGNGKKPLGTGGGLRGGISREDRWVVRFDEGTLDEYARQMDFFKIEMGALFPNGRLTMITNLAAAKPTVREVTSGKGENRLYFKWRGGGRQKIDNDLFKKAGINSESATILHFYPTETENLLVNIEVAYRNKKSTEIRKTYFAVRKDGTNYRFAVTSQSNLR